DGRCCRCEWLLCSPRRRGSPSIWEVQWSTGQRYSERGSGISVLDASQGLLGGRKGNRRHGITRGCLPAEDWSTSVIARAALCVISSYHPNLLSAALIAFTHSPRAPLLFSGKRTALVSSFCWVFDCCTTSLVASALVRTLLMERAK